MSPIFQSAALTYKKPGFFFFILNKLLILNNFANNNLTKNSNGKHCHPVQLLNIDGKTYYFFRLSNFYTQTLVNGNTV